MKSEKARKIFVIAMLIIIVLCIIGIMMPSKKNSDDKKTVETTTETPEETEVVTEPELDRESESEAGTKKSGSYDIDEMSIIYADSVRNDVTGNWRLSKVTGNKSAEEYAADYYKELFGADNEIHAVVNFTLNTTASITYTSGIIDVRIYEYVDGEEHDAKELFTGEKLAEYHVNSENGEIEKVE